MTPSSTSNPAGSHPEGQPFRNGANGQMPDLESFAISPSRGFLPTADPVLVTGIQLFDCTVGRVAHDLPRLMTTGRLRSHLDALPDIDISDLLATADEPRVTTALMRTYSFLAHAYVWCGPEPATVLPRNIAVPFHAIATHLGRPPVLSYASYGLDNWQRIDPAGPVEIGNIRLIQNFLGGLDEDWFILIHIEIEARAAAAIAAIPDIVRATDDKDVAALIDGLTTVEAALRGMHATLCRMTEACDPYIYYTRARPYIHGWKDNPSLPDGLVYEGVGEYGGTPQRFRGETGAQSSIIPALDALLGIGHDAGPLHDYLMEMRDYMPPGHRAFVAALEAHGGIRHLVERRAKKDAALSEAYNACVDGVYRFRQKHLEYAATYIHQQAQRSDNPIEIGTGGTPFMAYLKKHRDESSRHRID